MKRKLLGLAVMVAGFCMMADVQAAHIDDVWDQLVKDGKLEISAIAPDDKKRDEYNDFVVTSFVKDKLKTSNYYAALLLGCNESYECEFSIQDYDIETQESVERSERVQVIWQEGSPTVKKVIDEYIDKIESLATVDEDGNKKKVFYINDLPLISGIIDYDYDVEELFAKGGVSYFSELNSIFNGLNVTSRFESRNGLDTGFYMMLRGALTLWYDGLLYGVTDDEVIIDFVTNYYFYIPENTENTPDAYIAAAKKRIDEYFGEDDIKIEVAGTISDIEDELNPNVSIDKTTMGDYYYEFTINGHTFNFLIVKSSELTTPVVETKDVVTNVSVKSTSPDVPMDVKVIVNEVVATAPEYVNFVEKVKKEVVKAFDISLYSNTVGNITKLDNGVFEVKIPLGLEYVGRKLSAYYVREDATLEEHPITLDSNGNAVFETTHFSTYFIADASNGETEEVSNGVTEEVPKTFDKVDNYIILAISGVVGLLGLLVFFRTKSN